MKRGLLLHYPSEGWSASAYADLFPGAHAAVFGGYRFPLEAEDAGFEVRDSITVIGPKRHQVWLLRKPVEAGNVAAQVLKTGTGAIWIDGCRVTTDDNLNGGAYTEDASERWDGTENWRYKRGEAGEFKSPSGRWPSNLVLVHGSGCRRDGTRKIKAITGTLSGSWRKGHQYSGGWSGAAEEDLGSPVGYGDKDGLETVTSWACEPGCQVAALDAQSGVLKSGYLDRSTIKAENKTYGAAPKERVGVYEQDQGGASRFFPQFRDEAELDEWLLRLILGSSE